MLVVVDNIIIKSLSVHQDTAMPSACAAHSGSGASRLDARPLPREITKPGMEPERRHCQRNERSDSPAVLAAVLAARMMYRPGRMSPSAGTSSLLSSAGLRLAQLYGASQLRAS
jgi:hypothetical protein